MAEYYGYFNGLEYDENFVALVNRILVKNGVFDDGLMVSALNGMIVEAAVGAAIIDGFIYYNDAPKNLTIATANASLPRTDSIMLRWNIPNKAMNLIVVTGTAQSNPTAPAPVRNGTYYDFQIATVRVNAGVASITQANITDTRPNENVCGITSGYNSVDIDAMMAQYNAEFDEWFEQMKGQLSTDAAGNLQNQINNIPNLLYPVGSIYLSVNNVNPGTLFPGLTWVSWGTGRVPVGVDTSQTEFNTVEKTGGSKTHVNGLTTASAAVMMGSTNKLWMKTGSTAFNGNRTSTIGTIATGEALGVGGSATLIGNTDPASNLPPYITCYMWKRTA